MDNNDFVKKIDQFKNMLIHKNQDSALTQFDDNFFPPNPNNFVVTDFHMPFFANEKQAHVFNSPDQQQLYVGQTVRYAEEFVWNKINRW